MAQELEQARQERADRDVERRAAALAIEQLTPDEAVHRREAEDRRHLLQERLRLHGRLMPLAEALEREGPVSVLPRLPRAAAAADLEALIDQRRAELGDLVRRELDLLRDYRPTFTPARDSVTFHEERLALSAAELQARLGQRVAEYEGYIEEEQRRLFEEIIYEHILDELRRFIRQAREFTRKTNEKLKALRLSNGEELSLRLSPRPADQYPGARIAAALEQMEQGSRFLAEDKRAVLLSIIKEEVDRVRAAAQAAGQEITYHEAVEQALDYRNWFEYHLLSKMPGSTGPVPIRTRGFGRRSTSAKAWALAVPVIAAVAARYDASPRTDAPRLIGLDEAFAGFDSNNQENYLRFLGDLGFCWVVTGPDELPYSHALSAAMTYRLSLEGNVHAAFPILWNGEAAFEPAAELEREVAATGEA